MAVRFVTVAFVAVRFVNAAVSAVKSPEIYEFVEVALVVVEFVEVRLVTKRSVIMAESAVRSEVNRVVDVAFVIVAWSAARLFVFVFTEV